VKLQPLAGEFYLQCIVSAWPNFHSRMEVQSRGEAMATGAVGRIDTEPRTTGPAGDPAADVRYTVPPVSIVCCRCPRKVFDLTAVETRGLAAVSHAKSRPHVALVFPVDLQDIVRCR